MPFDFPILDYGSTIMPLVGEEFEPLPHIKMIAHKLEQVFCGCLPGGKKNLIINIPPRHGKTNLVAKIFPSWCMGLSPKSKFILTSYSAGLSVENSLFVKNIIDTPQYKELFPWVKIDNRRENLQHKWHTTEGGGLYAVNAGGQITGFGAGQIWEGFYGAIIIDDPMKPLEARSATIRKTIIEWYNGTLRNRKNRSDTPIIIIMQRLHPDDLCGFLLKTEPQMWDVLSIPVHTDGNFLWPEKVSPEEMAILKEVDQFTYNSQYMQRPTMPGGNMIKRSWWQAWNQDDLNKCSGLFFTADTAFKKTKTADYSCISTWAYSPEALLLIDRIKGRWEWPELVNNAKDVHLMYSPTKANELPLGPFIIEDKASGTSLWQMMQAEGIDVRPWSPQGRDKVFWARDMITPLYKGLIKIPESAPWLDDFLLEASEFTEDDSHSHDDQVNTAWIAHDVWRNYAKYH